MSGAKDALKLVIGRAADLAFPALGREIDETRNTAHAPRLKRAILHARLHQAQARGDVAAIETALAAFWKGDAGDKFHDTYAEERLRLFREQHAGVIDVLAAQLKARPGCFSRLVEIGCGDGTVLAHAAARLPGITRSIGLDINASVIARISAEQPAGGKLAFAEAEALDWLLANPMAGTVVLSNGGVLEYFSQANFDGLLKALATALPAAVVLIEPVAPEHDLRRQPDSFAFGRENSFSHNHRHRLTQAGFEVVHEQEMALSGVRWMLMIGILGNSAG